MSTRASSDLFERLRSGEHVALPDAADDDTCGSCRQPLDADEPHLPSCRWYRWRERRTS